MKRNEQFLLIGLAVVGLLVGFWLAILSPKRSEATKLQDEVDQLQSSLADAQQQIAAGQQARRSFGVDYRRLVVLGKAVPADSEQSSLLIQLEDLANRSGVEFQTMDLGDASGSATAAAASTSTSPTTTDTSGSTSTDTSTTSSASDSAAAAPATALATEASASTLPLGASVGPAGLPVMPYDLSFTGGFFQIADFMKRLDAMVHMHGDLVDVRGRLLTVDGFTLTPADSGPVSAPQLTADLSVTTFLTPADQGITAGATPTGPSTPTLTSSTTSVTPSSTTAIPSSTSSAATDATATTSP